MGGSFSSQNEAECRLGIIAVGEELLVTEACLSAHCQQGNRGPHLKWLTSDVFINLTGARGLVLALGRGMDADKDRKKRVPCMAQD